MSEDVLQTAEKRSEKHGKKGKIYQTECSVPENSKEERERKKKSFLNEQYRKVKKRKRKRMGKTRGLFKKIEEVKEIFHAKIDTIKDRNGNDLRKAEEIKKRWQEYTLKNTQKKF